MADFVEIRVSADLAAFERCQTAIARGLRAGASMSGSDPIADMKKQWAKRYGVFVLRHFDSASRGGSDWPPLALSTIRKRRRPKGRGNKAASKYSSLARDTRRGGLLVNAGGSFAVLKDTGSLRNGLVIGSQSNDVASIRGGVAFGYAAGVVHPGSLKSALSGGGGVGPRASKRRPLTIADLAVIHNDGVEKVSGTRRISIPRRRILIDPDDTLLRKMQGDAKRAIQLCFDQG